VRWLRERVRIQSEIAEISSNKGEYDRAENSCRKALEELSASPPSRHDSEIRREEMVLLGNPGAPALAALPVRGSQEALRGELEGRGEARSHIPEKASSSTTWAPSMSRKTASRKPLTATSGQKGYPPGWVTIKASRFSGSRTLAVLHAKTGQAKAADAAISRAAELEARSDSSRPRFLRLHSSGIVDLYFGRYASAMDAFKAAIAVGEALEDRHMIAFDLVFLAECHLFRGELKAARRLWIESRASGHRFRGPFGPW